MPRSAPTGRQPRRTLSASRRGHVLAVAAGEAETTPPFRHGPSASAIARLSERGQSLEGQQIRSLRAARGGQTGNPLSVKFKPDRQTRRFPWYSAPLCSAAPYGPSDEATTIRRSGNSAAASAPAPPIAAVLRRRAPRPGQTPHSPCAKPGSWPSAGNRRPPPGTPGGTATTLFRRILQHVRRPQRPVDPCPRYSSSEAIPRPARGCRAGLRPLVALLLSWNDRNARSAALRPWVADHGTDPNTTRFSRGTLTLTLTLTLTHVLLRCSTHTSLARFAVRARLAADRGVLASMRFPPAVHRAIPCSAARCEPGCARCIRCSPAS